MVACRPLRTVARSAGLALLLLAGPAALPALAGPAPGQVVPRPTVGRLLLDWSFDPLVALPLLVLAVLYLEGRRRIRERGQRWPAQRTACFLGGLAAIVVALQSPLEAYDTPLFSVHVVQHLMLTMVATPLIAMGAPITMLLMTVSARRRKRIVRVVHSGPVKVIGHPLTAWALFTLTLYALYFSPLFDLSLRDPFVHDLVHLHFVAVGLLFWWPVVGVDPTRWRLHHLARVLYLFLMVPFHAFLGVAIMNSRMLLAPTLGDFVRPWGPTPLADQQAGGAIMWGVGDIISLVSVIAILAAWASYEEKVAAREDRRIARERAARARAVQARAPQAPAPQAPATRTPAADERGDGTGDLSGRDS
ncbi:MAG TPA: cytochrome c oxidase assembly protein [Actinomycetes bacterium]|jgi:putative copper resistance protein D|nr:cytochrome c oxidase assembly protein [Actinomycetes bacterium]